MVHKGRFIEKEDSVASINKLINGLGRYLRTITVFTLFSYQFILCLTIFFILKSISIKDD